MLSSKQFTSSHSLDAFLNSQSHDQSSEASSVISDGPNASMASYNQSTTSLNTSHWIQAQEKAFLRWVNIKLSGGGFAKIDNLRTDLSSGLSLYHLIKVLIPTESQTLLSIPYMKPIIQIQKLENLNSLLSFLKKQENIQLFHIGGEDIVEGNIKLILGLIWSLILNYTLIDMESENSEVEELLSKKEFLLKWCQKITRKYADRVEINNFTTSWSGGLAMCAILHHFDSSVLDFEAVCNLPSQTAVEMGLTLAETKFDIPRLLDVEDLNCAKPEEKSVMAYVTIWYDAFHKLQSEKEALEKDQESDAEEEDSYEEDEDNDDNNTKYETDDGTDDLHETEKQILKQRIETFSAVITHVIDLKEQYSSRAAKLVSLMNETINKFSNKENIVTNIKELRFLRTELLNYRSVTSLHILQERNFLFVLLQQINLKLTQFNLSPYEPCQEKSIFKIEELSNNLKYLEYNLYQYINEHIAERQHAASMQLEESVSQFDMNFQLLKCDLDTIEDDFENHDQLKELKNLFDDRLLEDYNKLDNLRTVFIQDGVFMEDELKFKEMKIELNTCKFKLELLTELLTSKMKFIETNEAERLEVERTLISSIDKYYSHKSLQSLRSGGNGSGGKSSPSAKAKTKKKSQKKSKLQLTKVEMERFEYIFEKMDNGNKGYLSRTEFKSSLRLIYPNLQEEDINELFEFVYLSTKSKLRGVNLGNFFVVLNYLLYCDGDDEEQFLKVATDLNESANIFDDSSSTSFNDTTRDSNGNKMTNLNGELEKFKEGEKESLIHDRVIDFAGDFYFNTFNKLASNSNEKVRLNYENMRQKLNINEKLFLQLSQIFPHDDEIEYSPRHNGEHNHDETADLIFVDFFKDPVNNSLIYSDDQEDDDFVIKERTVDVLSGLSKLDLGIH